MIYITEEQKELVEINHNLIYSFLQKQHLSVEDWYGLAAIGLCRAAITFNKEMSSFSTYAYKCMFTHVYSEKRKELQARTIPSNQIMYYQAQINDGNGSETNFMNFIQSKENVEETVLSDVIFDEYNKLLNDRDKKIFVLFRDGYTQKEISKIVGCSQPQVSRVKKKLTEYLYA